MSIASAAYSVQIRVMLPNRPGTFALVAEAIGSAGGTLGTLDIVDATAHWMTRDVTIYLEDITKVGGVTRALDALDDITVVDVSDRTVLLHRGGKIEVHSRIPALTREELSMAYTPGVARVCKIIDGDIGRARELTMKGNSVAIVTDGSAVLGLGDIGPTASLPVMEGKALLFKEFANINAFPICLDIEPGPNSIDHIVDTVVRLAPAFGGINLEDVAAPRCFEIEKRLQERLDSPVFHDDEHGTAVVVLAALRNALALVNKDLESARIVMSGAGAAGVAIASMLLSAGATDIVACDQHGAIFAGRTETDTSGNWMRDNTNADGDSGPLRDVLHGADVFIGVSVPNLLRRADIATMNSGSVVFSLANPDPEVPFVEADGVAAVYATGRSDYPNQINNVLSFPGIFRGALDGGATEITQEMKLAAAHAIAASVKPDELSADYIIPSVFNHGVSGAVAAAVAAAVTTNG